MLKFFENGQDERETETDIANQTNSYTDTANQTDSETDTDIDTENKTQETPATRHGRGQHDSWQ